MTPAEELREAARLMRGRAQAAELRGPSPWQHEPSAEGRLPVGEDVFDSSGTAVAIVRGSYLADHITGMHPGVAVAVADWLEAEYRHSRASEPGAVEEVSNLPLMVARAYLAPVLRDAQGDRQ